jgi:ABC-2 type transport system permease protein
MRSGVLFGYVFGLYVASTALGFSATYKTAAQRAHLAALFGHNGGTSALVGPGYQLQTVGGFTVWKSLVTLTIVGAVWAMLLATRLMRGEEESGRWELMLSGQTTPAGATRQAIMGLGGALAILTVLAAAIIAGVGLLSRVKFGVGSSLFFALALASAPAMWLAAGALASQLASSRRRAAAYCAALLGASYAVRMVADSGTGLGWLRWVSPLGWVEDLRPLTSPDPWPLLPIFATVAALCLLAVRLSASRDVGSGTLPDRLSVTAHTRLLFGPLGLALRLTRPTFVGWGIALALWSFMLGITAKSGGKALSGSPAVDHVTARLGITGGSADAYLGIILLVAAVLLTLIVAGQISGVRAEESEGRLEHILARPTSRLAWLTGRIAITAAVLVLAGAEAGVFCWLGALTQNAGVGFSTMIEAGINTVAPALLVLGIGAFCFGACPRQAASAVYGVILWSLVLELVGAAVTADHWFLDTSVFHHMAPAPAMGANWGTNGVLVAAGAVVAVAGGLAFRRRDLVGD